MTEIKNSSLEKQHKTADSRRSFLKKAAVGAPLITTVTSTSVFALGRASISGNMSGNTSHAHEENKLNGCSPGYYHQHKNGNVNTGDTSRNTGVYFDTPFSDILSSEYLTDCDDSIKIVLAPNLWKTQHGWTSATQFHRIAITAYLNSLEFIDFPYTPEQIQSFYAKIGDTVGVDDAEVIFDNLIHSGGQTEDQWKSLDESLCGA